MGKYRNLIIAGAIFTAVQFIYFGFTIGLIGALIFAPVSGLLFGLVLYLFSKSKRIQNQTQILIDDNQKIIKYGAANHFKNAEAVGGRLYLLNDRLTFKSHKLNLQNHELEIPLKHIEKVSTFNSLGIIPNGIVIKTIDSQNFKFVVTGRKEWMELLHAKIAETE
jgi:phosphate/sulfate permease